jgi:hypothetical protein
MAPLDQEFWFEPKRGNEARQRLIKPDADQRPPA